MNTGRLTVAALAIWLAVLLLLAAGELSGALPTSLLTKPGPRDLFQEAAAGAFADLLPRERVTHWPRILFLALAPTALALVVVSTLRWAASPTEATLPAQDTTRSVKLHATLARLLMTSLRVVRGLFYLIAAWQVVTLLPLLSWLGTPDQVTGGMLAHLFIKVASLVICSLLTWALRKVVDWLHIRHFGTRHPALAGRRFAL